MIINWARKVENLGELEYYMNNVYEHKKCKASWAISTAETVEAALAIKNTKNASNYYMLIQSLLYCVKLSNGCISGYPNKALD